MSMPGSGLSIPDFGSRSGPSSPVAERPGDSPFELGVPPELEGRFRDCARARTRLEFAGGFLDVTAPWSGDRRTIPVRPGTAESGEALAHRLLRDGLLPVEADSITLLTPGGIAGDLQRELERLGRPLRVYEPTGELDTGSGFVIRDGGHWEIRGRRTVTHDQALTIELATAYGNFSYAPRPPVPPGQRIPLSDRAATVELLGTAYAAVTILWGDNPGLLDLTAAARVLDGHEAPGLLWPSLLRLLRSRLARVIDVADLYVDDDGRWRSVDLPITVRRMFTATGPYRLSDTQGVRAATFNSPTWLLAGAAAARPDDESFVAWLAESIVDHKTRGRPAPSADASGANARELQRAVIARLEALHVSPRDARLWADESFNAPPAELTDQQPGQSAPQTAAETPSTEDDIPLPLGGGVLGLLQHLPAAQPALDAGYELAAHFLRDRFDEPVQPADIPHAVREFAPAAVVAEVVALLHLRIHGVTDRDTVPVLVRQSLPLILAAAGAEVEAFLSAHEADVERVLGQTFPTLRAGDLAGLSGSTRPRSALSRVPEPEPSTVPQPIGPWHQPNLDLRLTGQAPPDVEEIAERARESAALAAALSLDAGLTEVRGRTGSPFVGIEQLRSTVNRYVFRHPELEGAGQAAVQSSYRRDLVPWLAAALDALPPWDGRTDASIERVGGLLARAGVMAAAPASARTSALADALRADWTRVGPNRFAELPSGAVAVVWAHRDGAPSRAFLVQRIRTGGVIIIDTQTDAGVDLVRAASPGDVAELLGSRFGTLVDARGRIVTLQPRSTRPGPAPAPPTPVQAPAAAPAHRLAAPRFGAPSPRVRPRSELGQIVEEGPEELPVSTADVAISTVVPEPPMVAPPAVEAPDDPMPVVAALANLHLILDTPPSWVPTWDLDNSNQLLLGAARAFGERIAAQLASRLAGARVEPHDLTEFLHIESVAIVRGLASLAFLQAAAAREGFRRLPMRSRLPFAQIIDGLDIFAAEPGGSDAFTARGARTFLMAPGSLFREQLADHLRNFLRDRSLTTDTLEIDPPGRSDPAAVPDVNPNLPVSMELELLRPGPAATPLGIAHLDTITDLAARYGPHSPSAQNMRADAASDVGRRRIEQSITSAMNRQQRPGDKTGPRPAAPAPWSADGVFTFVPGGQLQHLAGTVLARAQRTTSLPGTVTVVGRVSGHGYQVFVLNDRQEIRPNQLIAAHLESRLRSDSDTRPVLVLSLGGNADNVRTFGRRMQREIDRRALLGHAAPGVVVGVVDGSAVTTWYVREPDTENLVAAESLEAAVRAARDHVPPQLDVAGELRQRIGGYTSNRHLTAAEFTQTVTRRGDTVPGYSERHETSIGSFPETEVEVPVRMGARGVEWMDTARSWLNPQVVREVVNASRGRITVPVRIGPGLRAVVHELPATAAEPATSALTVTPETLPTPGGVHQVWVNRHRPVPGRGGRPVELTAVPLNPYIDWSFLDTLPVDVLEHVTVETGQIRNGLLETGGERLPAAAYASRLYNENGAPIVILTDPDWNPDESLPFITWLSGSGIPVVRSVVRVHGGNERSQRWEIFRNGKRIGVVSDHRNGLADALSNWTRGRRIVTPDDARRGVIDGTLRDPGSDAAMVLRRGMARAPLQLDQNVRVWISVPHSIWPHGPMHEFLRHYPAGFVPVGRHDGMRHLEIHLPARYVGLVGTGVQRGSVVDLAELIADGARLDRDGHVVFMSREDVARGVVQRVGRFIENQLRRAPAAETATERAERLFRTLTGPPPVENESAALEWARNVFARPGRVSPRHLRWLGPGAITPVWLADGRPILAIGTEEEGRPLLLEMDGRAAAPDVLADGEVDLLLDIEQRLAQLDLSVQGVVEPAARGRTTFDPLLPLVREAQAIQAAGGRVPDELRRRMSRRVSVATRRMSVFGGDPTTVAEAQAIIGDQEPIDEAVNRAELLDRVSTFLAGNGSDLTREQIDARLDEVIGDMPPGRNGELADEVVQGVGLAVTQRAAGLATPPPEPVPATPPAEAESTPPPEADSAPLPPAGRRLPQPPPGPPGARPLPTAPLPPPPRLSTPLPAPEEIERMRTRLERLSEDEYERVLNAAGMYLYGLGYRLPPSLDAGVDRDPTIIEVAYALLTEEIERRFDGDPAEPHQWQALARERASGRRHPTPTGLPGGRAGTEAEDHSGFLEDRTPGASGSSSAGSGQRAASGGVRLTGFASRAAATPRVNLDKVTWVARHDAAGLKVVIDTGVFLTDGRGHYVSPSRPEDGFRQASLPVLEFVTEDPRAELDGDPEAVAVDSLETIVATLQDLAARARQTVQPGGTAGVHYLRDIFTTGRGWRLNPELRNVVWRAVITGGEPTVLVHHTRGVPVLALRDVMRGLTDRIWEAPGESHLDEHPKHTHVDGEKFAGQVSGLFHLLDDGTDEFAGEAVMLEGAMWLTYDHVAGLAQAALGDTIGGKKYSPIAMRQSLSTLRRELPRRVRDFLDRNAEAIEQFFEETLLERIPDYSDHYVAYRSAAARSRTSRRYERVTELPPGTRVRPLDAVRYAWVAEGHGRGSLRVGDYLDTMLRSRSAVLNQHEAFGVRTYHQDLDRARPDRPGLLLIEIRNDTGARIDPEQIIAHDRALREIVREAVRRAEQPGTAPDRVTRFVTDLNAEVGGQNGTSDGALAAATEVRFRGGLRSAPVDGSETLDPGRWVGERLADPGLPGNHPLRSWDDLSALIDRARHGGMVITPASRGQAAAVYMKLDEQVWRIEVHDNGAGAAEQWTAPSTVSGEEPPARALAFNHCADFLLTA
ncbi:hypothetical protein HH310_22915 [Actinoplanes sp. TBRC 11911]|uniref:hypothetical protein n=1 Tax=Actinoplanes sp. TBRC 11911 TaxID=2729386 RepID=UPI00145E00EF|nr:hypothetical protein [Actinoplanes sp. TBRC 11911]NMO54021.1 hypothetical protein [Actinoplanes sp. TBRC 11911]